MLTVYTYEEFCFLLKTEGNVTSYDIAFPEVIRTGEGNFRITDIMFFFTG